MKITSITTQIKKIPLKTPFITALRRVENVEFVRVKVLCDNGIYAFGEAPATKAITGEGLDDILNSLQSVQNLFSMSSPSNALTLLHKQTSIGSSAKAALDIAFVSLLAKETKVPLYKYFGAKKVQTLQTDITISLNSVSKMLQDSIDAYNNNMRIFKVKLGGDIGHGIKAVTTIANKLPNAKILVDANQAWSLEQSLVFIEGIKNIKVELIEQPVQAKALEDLKTITQSTSLPILADESAFNLQEVKEIIDSKSADMINIKLMKCGGVSQAVEILEYARKKSVQCMLGSMLEGPYSINATIHLALAYSDVIKYIDLDSPLLYKEMPKELDFSFQGSYIKLKNK